MIASVETSLRDPFESGVSTSKTVSTWRTRTYTTHKTRKDYHATAYFRQVESRKITSTVNISRRPSSIEKIRIHFPGSGIQP